ncbi:MAG TPA: hypothetical protein DIS66_02380, partial [Candidatus Omnitrophica bacterium]|nr:hypothetical protein [Candidatus Omnitrophota bacterium]
VSVMDEWQRLGFAYNTFRKEKDAQWIQIWLNAALEIQLTSLEFTHQEVDSSQISFAVKRFAKDDFAMRGLEAEQMRQYYRQLGAYRDYSLMNMGDEFNEKLAADRLWTLIFHERGDEQKKAVVRDLWSQIDSNEFLAQLPQNQRDALKHQLVAKLDFMISSLARNFFGENYDAIVASGAQASAKEEALWSRFEEHLWKENIEGETGFVAFFGKALVESIPLDVNNEKSRANANLWTALRKDVLQPLLSEREAQWTANKVEYIRSQVIEDKLNREAAIDSVQGMYAAYRAGLERSQAAVDQQILSRVPEKLSRIEQSFIFEMAASQGRSLEESFLQYVVIKNDVESLYRSVNNISPDYKLSTTEVSLVGAYADAVFRNAGFAVEGKDVVVSEEKADALRKMLLQKYPADKLEGLSVQQLMRLVYGEELKIVEQKMLLRNQIQKKVPEYFSGQTVRNEQAALWSELLYANGVSMASFELWMGFVAKWNGHLPEISDRAKFSLADSWFSLGLVEQVPTRGWKADEMTSVLARELGRLAEHKETASDMQSWWLRDAKDAMRNIDDEEVFNALASRLMQKNADPAYLRRVVDSAVNAFHMINEVVAEQSKLSIKDPRYLTAPPKRTSLLDLMMYFDSISSPDKQIGLIEVLHETAGLTFSASDDKFSHWQENMAYSLNLAHREKTTAQIPESLLQYTPPAERGLDGFVKDWIRDNNPAKKSLPELAVASFTVAGVIALLTLLRDMSRKIAGFKHGFNIKWRLFTFLTMSTTVFGVLVVLMTTNLVVFSLPVIVIVSLITLYLNYQIAFKFWGSIIGHFGAPTLLPKVDSKDDPKRYIPKGQQNAVQILLRPDRDSLKEMQTFLFNQYRVLSETPDEVKVLVFARDWAVPVSDEKADEGIAAIGRPFRTQGERMLYAMQNVLDPDHKGQTLNLLNDFGSRVVTFVRNGPIEKPFDYQAIMRWTLTGDADMSGAINKPGYVAAGLVEAGVTGDWPLWEGLNAQRDANNNLVPIHLIDGVLNPTTLGVESMNSPLLDDIRNKSLGKSELFSIHPFDAEIGMSGSDVLWTIAKANHPSNKKYGMIQPKQLIYNADETLQTFNEDTASRTLWFMHNAFMRLLGRIRGFGKFLIVTERYYEGNMKSTVKNPYGLYQSAAVRTSNTLKAPGAFLAAFAGLVIAPFVVWAFAGFVIGALSAFV